MRQKKRKNGKEVNLIQVIDDVIKNGLSFEYFPKLIFLVFLFIFYIFLNHLADRNVAEIRKLKYEVGNLKAKYRTIHSDYRNNRLQSSIAKAVKAYGIVENEIPPLKIKKKSEYKNEK